MAQHGLQRLTHRLVARQAKVSLAATTYYFETKQAIIAEASARLLEEYLAAFRRFGDRQGQRPPLSFRDFAMKVVVNAAGRQRAGTLAWCEIMLDAAHSPELRTLARVWFKNLAVAWRDIAAILGAEQPQATASSAIDIVMGLLLVVVPLGLSEEQVAAVLCAGAAPPDAWGSDFQMAAAAEEASAPRGRKAEDTRRRILASAIDLLVAEGPSAVTFRGVASRAQLTGAAPTYYFASIEALLNAAQLALFRQSKDRYRHVMAGVDRERLTVDWLTDLTATVFLREATEFGAVSLANFPLRLEAARRPELRPIVWSAIDDQNRAWRALLRQLSSRDGPLDALLMQCLFAGKLVRILATGSTTSDLADVRAEFARDLRRLVVGRHWAQAWY
jgi:DNA-binding transcriptional regulator YbjK